MPAPGRGNGAGCTAPSQPYLPMDRGVAPCNWMAPAQPLTNSSVHRPPSRVEPIPLSARVIPNKTRRSSVHILPAGMADSVADFPVQSAMVEPGVCILSYDFFSTTKQHGAQRRVPWFLPGVRLDGGETYYLVVQGRHVDAWAAICPIRFIIFALLLHYMMIQYSPSST